ncbi:hypothetical protein [Pantoea piersonii]|uniref:hypothetical protein n=1 Tax=Pantoea piersonii TaxID=2364647 RepID=UPI0028A5AB84|nr:hypothetical protein [Pantoea piersonii]
MIPQPCRANDILRDQFARLQTSRTPSMDRDKLISYAEAYRMLLEIDAADFAYWERITRATADLRKHFLWCESQHKHGAKAA